MAHPRLLFALIIMIVSIGMSAMAQKMIWIDDNGAVRTQVNGDQTEVSETAEVELYVTSWCPYCKEAINFFNARGIPFTAYDIEKDRSAARRKLQLDNRAGVPLAIINGQKIHGFSETSYSRALAGR